MTHDDVTRFDGILRSSCLVLCILRIQLSTILLPKILFTSWGIYSLTGPGYLPSFFWMTFSPRKNHQTLPIDQSCALPCRVELLKSPRQRVITLPLKNQNPPAYTLLSNNLISGLTALFPFVFLFVEQPISRWLSERAGLQRRVSPTVADLLHERGGGRGYGLSLFPLLPAKPLMSRSGYDGVWASRKEGKGSHHLQWEHAVFLLPNILLSPGFQSFASSSYPMLPYLVPKSKSSYTLALPHSCLYFAIPCTIPVPYCQVQRLLSLKFVFHQFSQIKYKKNDKSLPVLWSWSRNIKVLAPGQLK
jgi:hypothetical protein